MHLCFFFFFFQAEDGIRDLTVTGVQTCALPIYWCTARRQVIDPERVVWIEHDFHHVRVFERGGDQRPHRRAQHANAPFERRGGEGLRSEEHTSELQSQSNLVCRLLLEKKKKRRTGDRRLVTVGTAIRTWR